MSSDRMSCHRFPVCTPAGRVTPPAFEGRDDLVDGRVDDGLLGLLRPLRRVLEHHEPVRAERDVAVPHRRQAVGLVLLGVRLGADSEEPPVEQAVAQASTTVPGHVPLREVFGRDLAEAG
jgi:hypothetical protein